MLCIKVMERWNRAKEECMQEVHNDRALDYLRNLKNLGPEEFLATYPHPVLLENYLTSSSRTRLAQVKTVEEMDVESLLFSTKRLRDDNLLQARVIPLEKRDKNSVERMLFVGRTQITILFCPIKWCQSFTHTSAKCLEVKLCS